MIHCVLFFSKTLYPLLSTGSSQDKTLSRPEMTENMLTAT